MDRAVHYHSPVSHFQSGMILISPPSVAMISSTSAVSSRALLTPSPFIPSIRRQMTSVASIAMQTREEKIDPKVAEYG